MHLSYTMLRMDNLKVYNTYFSFNLLNVSHVTLVYLSQTPFSSLCNYHNM